MITPKKKKQITNAFLCAKTHYNATQKILVRRGGMDCVSENGDVYEK